MLKKTLLNEHKTDGEVDKTKMIVEEKVNEAERRVKEALNDNNRDSQRLRNLP